MQIELEKIYKSFGRTQALSEVTLDLPPSSVVVLLGENGAGKSTLLRIMAGLCVPDSGLVRYDGVAFSRENLSLRRRLHFTPDIPLLFPEQSVGRNIATFAALYEKETKGREDFVAHWLKETGSASLMRRTVSNLSRGQIYKAGLACVAMIEPELWLVDEPFASGMDALGMGAFRRLVKHLTASGGTVVYTTQMVDMAMDFSDHVCVIKEGETILWDSTTTIQERIGDDPEAAEKILTGNWGNP
ncbi:ABC transporter ATP-binding protein [Haloferula chungangensis]|uniref:ABC transporter ATP-binding protein n=1 Tax=Haloferula chungangensis TaxID=1048331 RepID=A0ABW2L9Y0_9BACT